METCLGHVAHLVVFQPNEHVDTLPKFENVN